jgi:hypothetical protein
MPHHIHLAEVEVVHDGVEVGGGVGEGEVVGVVGLAAAAEVDRDTPSRVPEPFGVLIHRLEVCAPSVEQEQCATVPAVIAVGDPRAVGGRDPTIVVATSHPGSMLAIAPAAQRGRRTRRVAGAVGGSTTGTKQRADARSRLGDVTTWVSERSPLTVVAHAPRRGMGGEG